MQRKERQKSRHSRRGEWQGDARGPWKHRTPHRDLPASTAATATVATAATATAAIATVAAAVAAASAATATTVAAATCRRPKKKCSHCHAGRSQVCTLTAAVASTTVTPTAAEATTVTTWKHAGIRMLRCCGGVTSSLHRVGALTRARALRLRKRNANLATGHIRAVQCI